MLYYMYKGAQYSVAPSANTIEGTLSKSLNDHESLKTYTPESKCSEQYKTDVQAFYKLC